MRRLLLCATAATAVVAAGSAGAAIEIAGTPSSFSGNDYIGKISAALGGSYVLLDNLSFYLTEETELTFTEVAAESGYVNSLEIPGAAPLTTLNDDGDFEVTDFATDGLETTSKTFGMGTIPIGSFSFETTSTTSLAQPGPIGSAAMGAYISTAAGGRDFFFLAYDDGGAGPDDNHDDYIVRVSGASVSIVPLPATGLLFLGALAPLGFRAWRNKGRADA